MWQRRQIRTLYSARQRRGRFEAGGSEPAAGSASSALLSCPLADVNDGSCDCSVLLDVLGNVRDVELAVETTCDEPMTHVVEDGSRAESVNLENCTESRSNA